jgi:hypothetical protein
MDSNPFVLLVMCPTLPVVDWAEKLDIELTLVGMLLVDGHGTTIELFSAKS